MKRLYRFLLISLGIFASAGICLAQNPTYTLSVNDITEGENWIEFDIDMTWTNPGTVPVFEFAGAQYFLNVNSNWRWRHCYYVKCRFSTSD
ncbi:MAG: hypothetical protein IPG99_19550 [Ignavibacteria bacterium]|nr:hypothetical protein [Ignavibacteria bacterium]